MPQPNQHMMRDQQLCEIMKLENYKCWATPLNFIVFASYKPHLRNIRSFSLNAFVRMLFFAHICLPLVFSLKTMWGMQSTAQSAQVNHAKTKPCFYECVRVNTFLSKCSCVYIFVCVFVHFHLCVCEPWRDHVGIVVFDECLWDIEILRIVPQQNTALLSHVN